jgi:hypothetical protein
MVLHGRRSFGLSPEARTRGAPVTRIRQSPRLPLGTQGLFNFGELGTEEAVHETEYRRLDQRKAIQIVVYPLLIAAVIAVGAFLVPLP